MSQNINPTYGSVVNGNAEKFSFVTHVPSLPSPSRKYADLVLLDKTNGCLYHCLKLDGKWVWEAVTSGINRRYVLPVNKIIIGTNNNELLAATIYNTLRNIVNALKKYGDVFETLPNNPTLDMAMSLYDKLVDHVNRTCSVTLVKANHGVNGDTIPQFAEKVNLLIAELNPHADISLELHKFESFLSAVANIGQNASEALTSIRNSARSVLGITD